MTIKNDSAGIQDEFVGEVQHIHGNLFRVKRSSIRLARKGISSSDGNLVYGNPRWFLNSSGGEEAKGIERSKMEELKGSIRERGMDHPIRLRATKDRFGSSMLEMVNGERRYRAIDELCSEEAKCFDHHSKEMLPATEVHEWVECRIEYMDDATALRCALRLNETGEVIGETANIHVVKVLKESGYDDQEILKATGKSLTWLRETEKIISLDEKCLEDFNQDRINRTVALRLALIKNVEERVSTLEKFKQAAEIRHSEKVAKKKAEMDKAMEEAHIEDAFADDADEDGDEDSAKMHKAKSSAAKKRADGLESEMLAQKSSKPKATGKDMQKVEGKNKPLSSSKIKSLYLKPLKKLVDAGGVREDGEDLDAMYLMFLQSVLESILSGNSDIMSVLDEHCPLADVGEYDSEEEEVIEASDEDSDEDSDSEEEEVIEASDEEEDEEEEEEEVAIEASDEDSDEEEEEVAIEASDEEEDYDSYIDISDEDESYEDEDEMTDELEREFEEEVRSMDRNV